MRAERRTWIMKLFMFLCHLLSVYLPDAHNARKFCQDCFEPFRLDFLKRSQLDSSHLGCFGYCFAEYFYLCKVICTSQCRFQ